MKIVFSNDQFEVCEHMNSLFVKTKISGIIIRIEDENLPDQNVLITTQNGIVEHFDEAQLPQPVWNNMVTVSRLASVNIS